MIEDGTPVLGKESPTVAHFVLAGRPRPPVEDTVRVGELMRLAALSQFGWKQANGRKIPNAPWQVSGRDSDGNRLMDPSHAHAFWLPEDADNDGLIDRVSVYIASGIDRSIRDKLNQITRLWMPSNGKNRVLNAEYANEMEWSLALEGFGQPIDFAANARIFSVSKKWRSVTPFLASGYLKAAGYAGEIRRLLKRRAIDARFKFDVTDIIVEELQTMVDEFGLQTKRFHRFRSRGGERQLDTVGAMIEITFPNPVEGPLALGFGSHFGLGLFVAAD